MRRHMDPGNAQPECDPAAQPPSPLGGVAGAVHDGPAELHGCTLPEYAKPAELAGCTLEVFWSPVRLSELTGRSPPTGDPAALEAALDRPGWTAAWSYEYHTWYWWNERHETTWDDPVEGEPMLVPSEPVPQNREEQYMRGQSPTQTARGASLDNVDTVAEIVAETEHIPAAVQQNPAAKEVAMTPTKTARDFPSGSRRDGLSASFSSPPTGDPAACPTRTARGASLDNVDTVAEIAAETEHIPAAVHAICAADRFQWVS
jgi:hypothetical protein